MIENKSIEERNYKANMLAKSIFRHENSILAIILIALVIGMSAITKGLFTKPLNMVNVLIQSSMRGVTGLCIFAMWPGTLPLTEVISALTGWEYTIGEGLKAGRRIQTLRRAFNIREDINTSNWLIPNKIALASSGPNKGKKIDFSGMKENGYEALGWDPTTGRPLELTLDKLGLKKLVGSFL